MNTSIYYATNQAFAKAVSDLYAQSNRPILEVKVSVLQPQITHIASFLFFDRDTKDVTLTNSSERWERINSILRIKYNLVCYVVSPGKPPCVPTYPPSLTDILRIGPLGMHRNSTEEVASGILKSLKDQKAEIDTLSAIFKSQLEIGLTKGVEDENLA